MNVGRWLGGYRWEGGKEKERWEDGKGGKGVKAKMGRWNVEGGKVKKLEKGQKEGKGWARRENDLGEGK